MKARHTCLTTRFMRLVNRSRADPTAVWLAFVVLAMHLLYLLEP